MKQDRVGRGSGHAIAWTLSRTVPRLKTLATAGGRRGLVVCAVVDGKGWSERPTALLDLTATGGRTYTLTTLPHLLGVPEVAALRGTVPPVET